MTVAFRETAEYVEWYNPNDGASIAKFNRDGTVAFSSANFSIGAGGIGTAEIAAAAVTSPKVAADVVQTIAVTLTNDQIVALKATPVELIPAPGALKYVTVDEILVYFDVTTTGYTENSNANTTLTVEYSGGVDVMVIEPTGFIDQTADQARLQRPNFTVLTPAINTAIVVHNAGATSEISGGNAANVLKFYIRYRIVDVT